MVGGCDGGGLELGDKGPTLLFPYVTKQSCTPECKSLLGAPESLQRVLIADLHFVFLLLLSHRTLGT